ncbi:MAG TPA: energy-coupling factor transporter ATPase [Candidatus Binataceae bacterium]|nr:energy-coupling factor transporter ATPase [Candidatus Binataceae bacterium]
MAEIAVRVEDMTFTYAGNSAPSLRNVNLTQCTGEMIGIMGASGAGKSTLAKVLNKIVPELEGGDLGGVVMLNGKSIADWRVCDLASDIGMVFQDFESQLFSTTVAHEVAFAMERVGMPREQINARLGPALEAVGLRGFEDRDPTTLSGGQKQRLAIASVLALRPRVVVLDEPTTDLDPEGRAEVFALIRQLREEGISLIVIEHEAEELRQCDRVVILREGTIIAEGTPATVMPRIEMLEECGINAPDLDRVAHLLGLEHHPTSIEDAEAYIGKMLPHLSHGIVLEGDSRAVVESKAILEVNSLRFAYPDSPQVLNEISLTIRAGEFIAIVGQNGSGKTTLAKMAVGLLAPDSGTILLEGRDRTTLRPAETAREIGYVFQNPDHQIFADTVEAEVMFGPRNFGLDESEVEARCSEVLHAVGLENERATDPFLLGKGQRQRLAVASVLALRPRLLILDEPTTGLDYREQRKMMKLVSDLNAAGVAIVMITHTPWLVAEYARRVILMRAGRKLFDGPVREFFVQDELLRSSSFKPPEVTALSRRFGTLALSANELARWLQEGAR